MGSSTFFQRFQSLPRDKADTLLLLTACALVLAPHAGHLPLWVPWTSTCLLVWRGWITFRGNRMPPRWLLLPLAVGAMAGVFFTYRTFFGREAGVTMLVLLLALKLLEMRAKRDLFVITFLSFFLMLAAFFYSQSIATAAYMLVALVALLTTQLSFQYIDTEPPLGQRLRIATQIVALAVPVMLVMFVLFPRVQGPLWGLPGDANSGRTGLSDTMSPGNISSLAQSDDIAFRVKFIDPPPSKDKLYWRGIVLTDYDGRTWTRLWHSKAQANRQILVRQRGTPIRHQVTLEPSGQRWLFALELPQAAPQLPNNSVEFNSDLQLLARRPINERIRYDVTSHIDFDLQPNENVAVVRHTLALPGGYNPATRRYAARLRNLHHNPVDIVNAVLQTFRSESFSYTLEPPLLGKHAVDEFLFSTRAGFCEHYSSAFVVLMRAAGIPARVVTGYQGGELNPVDGFMSVRQSDAHAWAEVWLQDRGWVRIDPTGAVAPWRVEKSLSSGLPRRLLSGLVSFDIENSKWLSHWRMSWDAVTNRWNQWVLNYSSDRQKSLLRSLGFTEPDWRTMTALMFGIGMLVVAAIAVPLVRNRQIRDPVNACYFRLCALLARDGLPRAPHEGPRAYCLRVTAPESPLTPERKAAVKRFLQLYESIQYDVAGQDTPAKAASKLKSLLVQCR